VIVPVVLDVVCGSLWEVRSNMVAHLHMHACIKQFTYMLRTHRYMHQSVIGTHLQCKYLFGKFSCLVRPVK
jgi:hypothetical protein